MDSDNNRKERPPLEKGMHVLEWYSATIPMQGQQHRRFTRDIQTWFCGSATTTYWTLDIVGVSWRTLQLEEHTATSLQLVTAQRRATTLVSASHTHGWFFCSCFLFCGKEKAVRLCRFLHKFHLHEQRCSYSPFKCSSNNSTFCGFEWVIRWRRQWDVFFGVRDVVHLASKGHLTPEKHRPGWKCEQKQHHFWLSQKDDVVFPDWGGGRKRQECFMENLKKKNTHTKQKQWAKQALFLSLKAQKTCHKKHFLSYSWKGLFVRIHCGNHRGLLWIVNLVKLIRHQPW